MESLSALICHRMSACGQKRRRSKDEAALKPEVAQSMVHYRRKCASCQFAIDGAEMDNRWCVP
jgi:hypothetical protein